MPKIPHPMDKHVGSQVRLRRMMLKMSQEKLGDALGLTFQQVQKYEKGTNRIGAGRLQQIATILQVPVTFFYEGALTSDNAPAMVDSVLPVSAVADFNASATGLRIITAFHKIDDMKLRARFADLIEQVASAKSVEQPAAV